MPEALIATSITGRGLIPFSQEADMNEETVRRLAWDVFRALVDVTEEPPDAFTVSVGEITN